MAKNRAYGFRVDRHAARGSERSLDKIISYTINGTAAIVGQIRLAVVKSVPPT